MLWAGLELEYANMPLSFIASCLLSSSSSVMQDCMGTGFCPADTYLTMNWKAHICMSVSLLWYRLLQPLTDA